MQLSKAAPALSLRKPVPLQSLGNRTGSYPQLTALPHSSKNEDTGCLGCLSVVIKHLNKGNADKKGFILLTVQGYSPLLGRGGGEAWRGWGPMQQELEAAGHLTSTARKERAMNSFLCVLNSISRFHAIQDPSPRNVPPTSRKEKHPGPSAPREGKGGRGRWSRVVRTKKKTENWSKEGQGEAGSGEIQDAPSPQLLP